MVKFSYHQKGGKAILMAGRSYAHQLDAKNRMRIPAKLREELGDGYVITIGTGGCLYVYTKEQMSAVKQELAQISPYRNKQLKAARFILSNMWDAEEDKQGRILLPERLREYAGLKKNIIVCQGPTCIEIWSEEVYNDYFNDVDFDDLADALDSLKQNG